MMKYKSASNLIIVVLLLAGMVSCSEKKRHYDLEFNNPFHIKNDFAESLYFLGPEVDSAKTEILAQCDCCASDLAFINDSVFVYVVRCLGGDVFLKGNYQPVPYGILLRYDDDFVDGEEIATINESGEMDFKMEYKLENESSSPELLIVSKLNSAVLLTQSFRDGSKLYGMKNNDRKLDNFKDNLKSEGIWKMLKL